MFSFSYLLRLARSEYHESSQRNLLFRWLFVFPLRPIVILEAILFDYRHTAILGEIWTQIWIENFLKILSTNFATGHRESLQAAIVCATPPFPLLMGPAYKVDDA